MSMNYLNDIEPDVREENEIMDKLLEIITFLNKL